MLKDKKTLEQELDELRASYESLKEDLRSFQRLTLSLKKLIPL